MISSLRAGILRLQVGDKAHRERVRSLRLFLQDLNKGQGMHPI